MRSGIPGAGPAHTGFFFRPARRRTGFGALIAGALVCALVAAPAQATLPWLDDPQAEVPSLAPLLDRVVPAVVSIAVRTPSPQVQNPLFRDPFFRHFFGGVPENLPERSRISAGSGVIVDAARGLVMTNHHVVADAEDVVVTLGDGRTANATLVGSDPGTDIALLRIEADNLQALPFGNSERLAIGDYVVAVGNPFGLGQTVTSGIVSAVGRSGLSAEGYESFIQTDAPINPGNSGGGLVNLRGELVGINTAIISPGGGNIGIGFAVPSNMAREVMRQLVQFGEVRRGQLGVSVRDLTPDLANALGVNADQGAVVLSMQEGSAADSAGLEAGDVIVAFNGQPVQGSGDLRNKVGLTPVGTRVALTVLHEGDERQVQAQIGGQRQARRTPGGQGSEPAGPPTPLEGVAFEEASGEGVRVAQVERGTAAWASGLRAEDVVVAVNRRQVESVDQLDQAVEAAGNTVALTVNRDGETILIVL